MIPDAALLLIGFLAGAFGRWAWTSINDFDRLDEPQATDTYADRRPPREMTLGDIEAMKRQG